MGRTGRPRANQTATRNLDLYFARPTAHFPPQCPGEHMGGGAPPSANEAVEIAPSSTSVASIKRTIFSWEASSVGYRSPYFFRGRKSEVFEKRALKLLLLGLPTD